MSVLEEIPNEVAAIRANLFLDAEIFNMGDHYEVLCPTINSEIVARWLLRNLSVRVVFVTRVSED
jgi:hypothetical protein